MIQKVITSFLFLIILSACASLQPIKPPHQPYLDAKEKIQTLSPNEYTLLEDGTIYLAKQPLPTMHGIDSVHNNLTASSPKIGTLITPDGSVYHGAILHGKAEGFGRSHISTGEIYEGEHKQGHFEGTGNLMLSDGSVFKGRFRNNKAYQGEIYFTDGTTAELKTPPYNKMNGAYEKQ